MMKQHKLFSVIEKSENLARLLFDELERIRRQAEKHIDWSDVRCIYSDAVYIEINGARCEARHFFRMATAAPGGIITRPDYYAVATQAESR